MKKIIFALLAVIAVGNAYAQSNYRFDHGPYLQGLAADAVSVYFTTSEPGFSWVEVRKGDRVERVAATNDGLVDACVNQNAIRIEGLEPATKYEYRLVSKRIAEFQPYKVTYGDSIASPWYAFETLDPAARESTFAVISDIHGDNAKYRSLMAQMPMDSVQMVFLNGDTMDYFETRGYPYSAFIDLSVEMFAREKPFVAVRGNHETRGKMARDYHNYVYRPDGRYYGLYRVGETAVLVLDCGEDKPDDHPVYAGLTAFDDYRREEAAWLAEIVKSKDFRRSRHRIVLIHAAPTPADTDYVSEQISELFMPILNKAGIDLMICGHRHRREFLDDGPFPIMVDDNRSASLVKVSRDGIVVRTVDTKGNAVEKYF